jgi:protein-L-isoaspartate(D-aspartate) O-methyltransferase
MNNRNAGIGMTSQRTRMRMIERLRDQGVKDEVVLKAMAEIPRHIFVDEALASRAYDDVALPIGFGQTISNPSPYAHGRASGTRAAQGAGNNRCGYRAAVLRVWHARSTTERLAGLLSCR